MRPVLLAVVLGLGVGACGGGDSGYGAQVDRCVAAAAEAVELYEHEIGAGAARDWCSDLVREYGYAPAFFVWDRDAYQPVWR